MPTNVKINPLCNRIPFSHTALNSFAKAFKDYIHFKVYDGFTEYIFAPYQKLVQYNYQKTENSLPDLGLPLLNYDIQIIGIDEKVDGIWRNQYLTPALGCGVYPPFFKDKTMSLSIVNRRLKGSINLNVFASSYSQMIDIQTCFTDSFFGLNKFVPLNIINYTIIPDSFTLETVHDEKIVKNLTDVGFNKKKIKILNRNCYYIPHKSNPIIKLNSLTESINQYSSVISDSYSLTGDFEFEIEVPQYIMALTNIYKKIIFGGINSDYQYDDNSDSSNNNEIPYPGETTIYPENPGEEPTIIDNPYEVDDDYGVIVTPDDIVTPDPTEENPIPEEEIILHIPEDLEENECIKYKFYVKTPFGMYTVTDYDLTTHTIRIKKGNIACGDLLKVLVLKYNICIPGHICGKKRNN